jgi:anaerobic ribonucleoside-triphosphate reductase activating protein
MNCPGCWNPDTHDFNRTTETSVCNLVDWVLGIPGIDGVTFSGGEPFQQAGDLYSFCTLVTQRRPDFSIGAYTGYTLTQLHEGQWHQAQGDTREWGTGTDAWAGRILDTMDFLVAGKYVETLKCDDKPLCGSRNQQVHFLSDRYNETDLRPNVVEMMLDPDTGLMQFTGFPSNADHLTAEPPTAPEHSLSTASKDSHGHSEHLHRTRRCHTRTQTAVHSGDGRRLPGASRSRLRVDREYLRLRG